jgi:hypothetical protein
VNTEECPCITEIVETGTRVRTTGMEQSVGFELALDLKDAKWIEDAARLLIHLARHFASTVPLVAGQTVDWASSLLVARQATPTCIAFGEMDFDGETVLPTVDRAVSIWTAQSEICMNYGVDLCPTPFGKLMAVSPRVLEGVQRVEGIRYSSTSAMSGWWFFTEEYNGTEDDFRSMRPVHVFEVLRHRHDLAKFLGLPKGYAFRAFAPEAIWFESEDE